MAENSTPVTAANADATALRAAFTQAGQGHIFQYWDHLTADEKSGLLEQAAAVDLAEISQLAETLVRQRQAQTVDFARVRPAPYVKLPHNGGDSALWARARTRGETALRAGQVACFTVAGGQGTRLGYDGPKGMFSITPVRGHPLFQVFAEKIRAAGRRYGRTPPWFIMTSPANHAATAEFFQKHGHFGLDATHVHFFPQGQMPAVDFEGRLLLATPSSLALSPDGHGGALRALVRSGAVELMREAGVEMLSYFQVDNPLVRCVDPAFIGFHLEAGSDMSSKMVPKRNASEKVGHFCLDPAGRVVVIEYSDMPKEMGERREADGTLRFCAGSIAIHILDREFIARLGGRGDAAGRLPFHRADKKVSTVNAAGQIIQPTQANGVKFEMFVFDALPFAKNPVVIETERADDFSPVKNAAGEDSAQTCRDDQLRQFARWLRAAGVDLPVDATGLPPFPLEISPLFGDDAASVAARWAALHPKPALAPGLVLE